MDIQRGQILIVDMMQSFGAELGGERPAIVISENTSNRFNAVVSVAAITSKVMEKELPIRIKLEENESGLQQASTILCDHVYSIDKTKIKSIVGKVSDERMVEINQALKLHFNLND